MILEIFYDANCPFCLRRAEWIKKRDPHNDVKLLDVNKNIFFLELFGIRKEDALQNVHGIYANGKIVKGPDVVRSVLKILGFNKTLSIINLPVVSIIFNIFYNKISENKHLIRGI